MYFFQTLGGFPIEIETSYFYSIKIAKLATLIKHANFPNFVSISIGNPTFIKIKLETKVLIFILSHTQTEDLYFNAVWAQNMQDYRWISDGN